jgi:hypothetical protein
LRKDAWPLVVRAAAPAGHPAYESPSSKTQAPENMEWDLGLWNLGFPPSGGVARAVLKEARMLIPAILFGSNQTRIRPTDFWRCLLHDEQLRDCDNLEKLLVGCEIIAALDDVDLLPE